MQTLVVAVEAVLNDRPLTYVSTDVNDSEPLTPSHLLCGRRIISLPYMTVEDDEIDDPTYGSANDVHSRAKRQALTLQHFQRRWSDEYLTSLREFHLATGKNEQTIKVSDVVLVHDDTPQVSWKMAVIEELIKGNDGLVRAANIRTAAGRTKRAITRLVPLEVSCTPSTDTMQNGVNRRTTSITTVAPGPSNEVTTRGERPRREAARRGREHVTKWAQELRAAPKDVVD